jgi:5-hydroxyisourate hydrolase
VGLLTTHVLDTTKGKPAEGVTIDLYILVDQARQLINSHITNHDGRCDQPLLSVDEMQAGSYELDFAVSDYFSMAKTGLTEPDLFNIITIRFNISNTKRNYHIPLLVSPYSYATYQGS